MNEHETARLAAAVNALRPDWPIASLFTFITRSLNSRAYADAAVALTAVAVDPKSETPRRVLEAGPWWRGTTTEAGTYRPPRKDEACPVHAASYAGNCSGCAADAAVGDQATPADQRRQDRTQELNDLRTELLRARGLLCRHGVDRKRTPCRDCERGAAPVNVQEASA